MLFHVRKVIAFERAELGPLAHGLIVGRDEVQAEVGELIRIVLLRKMEQPDDVDIRLLNTVTTNE